MGKRTQLRGEPRLNAAYAEAEEYERREMTRPVIDAWLDEDGRHVWTSHACAEGRVTTMLPYMTWHVGTDGTVVPSVHCLACGAHEFVSVEEPSLQRATLHSVWGNRPARGPDGSRLSERKPHF